jgi:hypothetical protein
MALGDTSRVQDDFCPSQGHKFSHICKVPVVTNVSNWWVTSTWRQFSSGTLPPPIVLAKSPTYEPLLNPVRTWTSPGRHWVSPSQCHITCNSNLDVDVYESQNAHVLNENGNFSFFAIRKCIECPMRARFPYWMHSWLIGVDYSCDNFILFQVMRSTHGKTLYMTVCKASLFLTRMLHPDKSNLLLMSDLHLTSLTSIPNPHNRRCVLSCHSSLNISVMKGILVLISDLCNHFINSVVSYDSRPSRRERTYLLFKTSSLHLLGWPQVCLLKFFLNKGYSIYRMGSGGTIEPRPRTSPAWVMWGKFSGQKRDGVTEKRHGTARIHHTVCHLEGKASVTAVSTGGLFEMQEWGRSVQKWEWGVGWRKRVESGLLRSACTVIPE